MSTSRSRKAYLVWGSDLISMMFPPVVRCDLQELSLPLFCAWRLVRWDMRGHQRARYVSFRQDGLDFRRVWIEDCDVLHERRIDTMWIMNVEVLSTWNEGALRFAVYDFVQYSTTWAQRIDASALRSLIDLALSLFSITAIAPYE